MRCNDCELQAHVFKYTEGRTSSYTHEPNIKTVACIAPHNHTGRERHTSTSSSYTHIQGSIYVYLPFLHSLFPSLPAFFDWDIYRGYFILDWLNFFPRGFMCFRIYHLRCIVPKSSTQYCNQRIKIDFYCVYGFRGCNINGISLLASSFVEHQHMFVCGKLRSEHVLCVCVCDCVCVSVCV